MKIAVTSTGSDLDAQVDPRFGRAEYLLIVDTDNLEFQVIENPGTQAPGGAGVQAAQTVASAGAEAVVTGNVGPNAHQTLSAADVKVYIGASGTVREAVEAFKRGELQVAGQPSVGPHFGVGSGTGG